MNPRNEMLNLLDEAMTAIVNGKPEAAMIPLWKVHVQLRKPEVVEVVRVPHNYQTDKLPAMQPKRRKRVRAIDVTCPTCDAKPGEQCHRMTKRGVGGEVIPDQYVNHNHNPRIARARSL